METRYVPRFTRDPFNTPPTAYSKLTSILIAVPFVFCFSMFGIFNLIGGTVLIIMACSSRLPPKTKAILQRLVRRSNIKFEPQINPMQVVGIILLLTGSLLVIIGIALGIIACRSVNEHQRRRNQRMGFSFSDMPLYSLTERSSRHTMSVCSTSFISSRNRNGKKSFVSEKTISPILEVDREDESNGSNELENTEPHLMNDISPKLKRLGIISTPNKVFIPIKEADSDEYINASDSSYSNSSLIKVSADVTKLKESHLPNKA